MGNHLDWDEVVEDLGPRLFRYFCVRFSNEQSDDLTQETLIRLVRKVEDGKFDPDKGTLKMLAFGIAHYVAMESRQLDRHEPIENWHDSLEADGDLEQMTITKDAAMKVRGQMRNLSSVEQQILSLFVDENLTLDKIAMVLQMPEGTVKSHIFRAKKKLVTLIHRESVV